LATEINTSRFNRTIVISTTDPYFTEDGVSRTIDLFHRTSRPYLGDLNAYSLVSSGAGMRFGVPFSEVDRVFFGANLEQTSIRPGTNLPNAYVEYMQQFGYTSTSLPLTIGWARDGRDSALVPSKGILQRFNSDLSLAGDSRYIRTNYQIQHYTPLTKKFTLALNADIGYGQGLSNRPYPLFKNYFVGGLGSVRGFQQSSLGPSNSANTLFLGGAKKVVFNAEVLAPFPGAGNDRTLRLFAFADAGRAFAESQKISLTDLRSSVGIGLSWLSPMGPLRFSYAFPVKSQDTDKIQRLQFQIGTSF
jgi:outer membrane protein insertion porin family